MTGRPEATPARHKSSGLHGPCFVQAGGMVWGSGSHEVEFHKPTPAAYPGQGSGSKPPVKVPEQRDLASMVYLLVQQDGHHLARGSAAAQVARAGFEQVTVAR
jgi:hypothetical protein